MKAVILAGGKGTRLGSLTTEIPKPMVRIGNIPLLHHQINLLVKYGFKEIILLVNYLSKPIREYFGDGKKFGISVTCIEEPEPLGTTGGLKEIEDQLTDDFLVFYGDVMINMNLERLIRFHFNRQSHCTLVLHPNDHPYDSDLVDINEDGRVIAFHSKPHESGKWYHNMVNAGAYIFTPQVLNYIAKGKKADFGHDVFPEIINKLQVFGYHTSEYLKDMGTPDRLQTVKTDYDSGKIELSSYEYPQKAIFLDRDGVLNIERSFISRPEELELFDFTPAAIKKINKSGYLAVVVTNQSAIARNLCTEEDVRTIHKKLETELGNHHAWLDAIYFCPHHPDKGFPEENPAYKIVCDCRKPAIGMFMKAIEKFRIEPRFSYMIGDSERDVQAGINAGCITIGVRTGYGIKKTRIYPDFMFDNLKEAADFISDDPYKPYFTRVNKLYSEFGGKAPWIILIGGNTRSGKSILASYLRINFERSGKRVLQISLDNWIVPEHIRHAAMNVYERFRLSKIQDDIKEILDGKTITVSTYANHPQRNSVNLTYDPGNAQIIIIEGVTALSSEKVRDQAHLKIFTRIEHDLFIQRIIEYYTWRGKTAEEISEMVEKREIDEYQLIEKESKLADLIINSAGA
jgi:D,D-heptose 1,7-bisphosphate phosphatase